jgi:Tfp pilus assembly protein PilO
MKLGMSRRTAILVLACAFLAGNLAFFLWYRSTSQDRKGAMAARRDALAREVEAREKEAAAVAVQRDRLSRVSSAIDEFYGKRIGTPRETLAPIVLEVHGLLTKAGVAPASISYATKPLPDLPLMEMQIDFNFRNDYNQLKQLLGAIESGRRWIVVRSIGLARDKDLPGAVGVKMSLATYFVKGESGERATGPGGLSAGSPSPIGRVSSQPKRGAR